LTRNSAKLEEGISKAEGSKCHEPSRQKKGQRPQRAGPHGLRRGKKRNQIATAPGKGKQGGEKTAQGGSRKKQGGGTCSEISKRR